MMIDRELTVKQVRELAKTCGYNAALGPRKPRGAKSAKHRARFAATPPLVQTEAERQTQRSLFERHDRVAWTIRFPLSPSANNLKSIRKLPGRRPFLVPSTEYNVYKQAVAAAWRAHWKGWLPEPLTGRLRVLIVVHQARRGGDVANREKGLLDALVECGAIADDSQVDDLRLFRGVVIPKTGAVDLTVEVISE
jgi:Holliday junction resolvase RusA-like endonuclease